MNPYSRVKANWGPSYTCFRIFGNWVESGKLDPNTPNIWINTQKVNPNVKLYISHQMKSYSNIKTIWRLIYIWFGVFMALRQIDGTGPKYPRLWTCIYRKSSKAFNCRFRIKFSPMQVYRPSESRFITVLVFLWNWGRSDKLHRKSSEVLNSIFDIKLSIAQVEKPFESRFIPVLVFLWNWGKSGKLGLIS